MYGRSERRRSSELGLSTNKVQIGAHWKKPFSKIYDSTYGSHGRTYEDLLDPAVIRQRSLDRREGREQPRSYSQNRLSMIPERGSGSFVIPDDYPSRSFPREHVMKPLSVNRQTRSDDVLSIFGLPKASVPANFHDQELESYLQKIRSPRDPHLKLLEMERESRLMDDQAMRRATRMTSGSPEEAANEMYASANMAMQAMRAQF